MDKDKKIKAELKKLNKIFENINDDKKKTVQKLINNAAFMAVSLEELQQIINEKGYTETYKNGANQEGLKKCSEVEIYNVMIKNYMSSIKQLTDLMPKEIQKIEDDGFEDFVNSRDS